MKKISDENHNLFTEEIDEIARREKNAIEKEAVSELMKIHAEYFVEKRDSVTGQLRTASKHDAAFHAAAAASEKIRRETEKKLAELEKTIEDLKNGKS